MASKHLRWNLHHKQSPKNEQQLRTWLLESLNITDEATFLSPNRPTDLTLEQVGIDQTQMQSAIKRILVAKEKKQSVVIAGDYDADGLCATTVLWLACQHIGLIARPFIPDRHKHGYGINQRSLPDILGDKQPDLVITVDNGIVANEAIATLVSQSIDVILTDHHEPTKDLPPATNIVHTTQLCGAGVAWMLARELLRVAKVADAEEFSQRLLDFVAIATVADQVPLQGANRSIVYHGVTQLRETTWPGLLAMFEQSAITQSEITEQTIGFQIAPRLNALGRLSHGLEALRLLCGQSPELAKQRANLLQEANTERRSLTSEMYHLAREHAIAQKDEMMLVISDPSFHEGIIGLIAGRLVEEFGKPAAVIALGETMAKGSVRSIAQVHVTHLLRKITDQFLELGGHAMAGGFAVDPTRITEVTAAIQFLAKKEITAQMLVRELEVICPLGPGLVSVEVCELIEQLAPFGQGNPRPRFVLENWQVKQTKVLGKDRSHLKLVLEAPTQPDQDHLFLDALWWKHGSDEADFAVGAEVSVVGRIESRVWNHRQSVQLVVSDVKIQ